MARQVTGLFWDLQIDDFWPLEVPVAGDGRTALTVIISIPTVIRIMAMITTTICVGIYILQSAFSSITSLGTHMVPIEGRIKLLGSQPTPLKVCFKW